MYPGEYEIWNTMNSVPVCQRLLTVVKEFSGDAYSQCGKEWYHICIYFMLLYLYYVNCEMEKLIYYTMAWYILYL